MIVNLFDNQLVLEVPDSTVYLAFTRTEESIEFCKQFHYGNYNVLRPADWKYISVNVASNYFFHTGDIHNGCYDISNEFFAFISQKSEPQSYTYW